MLNYIYFPCDCLVWIIVPDFNMYASVHKYLEGVTKAVLMETVRINHLLDLIV